MTPSIQDNQTTQSFWLRYGFIWFILPFIALPLLTRGVSILSSLSLLIAIALLIKHYHFVATEIVKNRYLYLFLALFIPVLISLIDALTPALTVQTLWRMIRFAGYAVIALFVFRSETVKNRFTTTLFWILMLYCLDAICQWAFDYNIYGYNPIANVGQRVRGVFGERFDLSFFLATLSPLVFFYLFDKVKAGHKLYWYLAPLLLFIFVFTIIIGGARTASISLIVSFFLSVCYIIYQKKITNYKLFGVSLILFIAIIALVASQLDVVAMRYINRLQTSNNLDQLTSYRVNMWKVAWAEFSNYWINGVGARGFDALYQTYPESYKMYKYVNHPHLQGLEVLIETGIIGFIAYLGACLYLLIAFFRSQQTNPWLLIALLTLMPINSFFGLYEGNWLPVVFISLAIACTFSQTPQSK